MLSWDDVWRGGGRVTALLVVLVAVLFSGPAAAQESGAEGSVSTSSTTTTTSTSAPPSSSSTTSTTVAASTTDPSPTTNDTTVAGDATTTTTPPDPSSTDTADPLIDEAPADDPLDPNITVPPPSGADVEVDFAPVPILWSSVREAETKWADALTAKVEAIAEVRSLRLRAKELDARQHELEEQTQLTIAELAEATERLRGRAVRGFVTTSSGNATGAGVSTAIFRSHDVMVTQRKSRLIGAAVDVDRGSLSELADLRSTLDTSALELVRRTGVVDSSVRRAESAAVELDAAVDQARIELEAFKAGSEIYVDGVVFPIGGPYSVPLINSFGFPRMPGTPDSHAHQGIDIFAPRGTPLVAAERGVVGRVGIGRLGGLKLWLRGESGADWYYAHLDGFAPGLHNGQVVEAGELLGYVGNTGNAVGTPPHLHLEIHPDGGAAVNPYPLLKVVSDLDRNTLTEGTAPGFRYQPVVANRSDEAATPAPTSSSTSSTSAPSTTAQSGTTASSGLPPSSAPATTATSPPTTTEPTPVPTIQGSTNSS